MGGAWAAAPTSGWVVPAGLLPALPLVPGGERIDRVFQQEIQKSLLRMPGTDKPQLTAEEAAKAGDRKIKAVLERARRRFGER